MNGNPMLGQPLDAGDVDAAARALGTSGAHVRAVLSVEASGSGYLDGDATGLRPPRILFEAHVFARETGGRYNDSHPRLSSARWKRSLYQGGLAEHERLRRAAVLDREAAYRSASWGIFQVMGFNHAAAGYDRLADFVGVQYVSEGLQLDCGVRFIQANGLDGPLRQSDWRAFARGYNGPGYARNDYHTRLAAALEHFQAADAHADDHVTALQQALNRAGFNLAVDGIRGSRTDAAVREFQDRAGLAVDGIVGPATRAALGLAQEPAP